VPAGSGLEQALDAQGRVTAAYKRLGYGSVYEDLRTLALTWKVLEEQPQIEIPQDNRRLVEAVTHPDCLARLDSANWAKHGQNVEGEMMAKTLAADLATAVYDQAFGDFTFNESGARVRTRLGVDNLCLPLDRAVTSPFGMEMLEVVIPGHMAPKSLEETVAVEGIEGGAILLRCGGRRYRYSRFGLEESDESVD
jgi:CRISPR-associated endonuclease/helicase Cas3